MAVYAYKVGVVDTTMAGMSVTATPSRQQDALLRLKDDTGATVTPATATVSPHNPAGTLKGTTGAGTLNGSTK